jgi:hypothetical protein
MMGTPPVIGAKGVVFTRAIERIRDNPQSGDCLHEWSVDTIGDVNDIDRWYQSNPSLGYQLLEESLKKDASTMAEDTFAREHLGYMPKEIVRVDYAIDHTKWENCKSEELKPEGKTAYGVKFSPDGAFVAICGAVIPDNGKARISLIDIKPTGHGVGWLSDWLNQRYKKASCVVIDGRNGVDVLIDKMSETWIQKGSIIKPSSKDVIASVGMLTDSINEESLTWYFQQEALNDSALTSLKRPISGGWGFGGDNSIPIEACALAYWGAKTSKRNPNKKMRIG